MSAHREREEIGTRMIRRSVASSASLVASRPFAACAIKIHIRFSCDEARDTLADEGMIIDR
jgi:hypothetical protein